MKNQAALRLKYLIFCLLLTVVNGRAQTRLSEVDPSRISQKSILKFLKTQSDKGFTFLEDFKPSVISKSDSLKFGFNEHHFIIGGRLPLVWETYLRGNPAKIWSGKKVSLGMIYSTSSRRIFYPNDEFQQLETGQIFFTEMRICCGLIKFPVCFIVTAIDSAEHEITFSYLDSSQSRGTQTIRLTGEGTTRTKIVHSSIHQTRNWLRDKTLYPIYHKKAIKEVHLNIDKMLAGKK